MKPLFLFRSLIEVEHDQGGGHEIKNMNNQEQRRS